MKNVTLQICFDSDAECPDMNNDWWELKSFHRHDGNDPSEYIASDGKGGVVGADDEWQKKLDDQLAFVVSCYDHSGRQWGLPGEVFQCRWDTAQVAGILIFTGKLEDLPKNREESARLFLEEYTTWCNGDCYWYRFEDEDGEDLGTCGGFIGHDWTVTSALEEINNRGWHVTELTGDAADAFDLVDFKEKKPEEIHL